MRNRTVMLARVTNELTTCNWPHGANEGNQTQRWHDNGCNILHLAAYTRRARSGHRTERRWEQQWRRTRRERQRDSHFSNKLLAKLHRRGCDYVLQRVYSSVQAHRHDGEFRTTAVRFLNASTFQRLEERFDVPDCDGDSKCLVRQTLIGFKQLRQTTLERALLDELILARGPGCGATHLRFERTHRARTRGRVRRDSRAKRRTNRRRRPWDSIWRRARLLLWRTILTLHLGRRSRRSAVVTATTTEERKRPRALTRGIVVFFRIICPRRVSRRRTVRRRAHRPNSRTAPNAPTTRPRISRTILSCIHFINSHGIIRPRGPLHAGRTRCSLSRVRRDIRPQLALRRR
mmetsp:Transcript_2900/g.10516  ORF Transcript_2900/g.10516 Transcript_2900/m.10516 type:complete len:347 (+) Transcript_2900:646-1686(+)